MGEDLDPQSTGRFGENEQRSILSVDLLPVNPISTYVMMERRWHPAGCAEP